MRVTACELPHEPRALAPAWAGLCEHASRHGSDLVLLPEFAFVEPVWETERFDAVRWADLVAESDAWMARLAELGADFVVGSRPVNVEDKPLNQGYLWSSAAGLRPLRSKFFLPDEPGGWEARWYGRGDPDFSVFRAGDCTFGINICSELWALETYAAYAEQNVEIILSPRATAAATTAKWLSVGVVAAARSGAFSVSSNRVDAKGNCGGVGWVISPEGGILASTSAETPFVTLEIELAASLAARAAHPCNVFSGQRR